MASSLLDHTLLSAHDPKTGRYDARRLASTLEITTREMAAVVGYTPTGLGKNPASPRLQPKLRELVGLLNRLRGLLDGRIAAFHLTAELRNILGVEGSLFDHPDDLTGA